MFIFNFSHQKHLLYLCRLSDATSAPMIYAPGFFLFLPATLHKAFSQIS